MEAFSKSTIYIRLFRHFNQISTETASDTDNNNVPPRVFYLNNKPNHVIPPDTTSNSSSSKLNHCVGHSKQPPKQKNALQKSTSEQKSHFLTVKSKSDLNTLKTYPDSFTIITSPKRSPSAGYNSKRSRNNEEEDDSILEFEWIKPPAEKLYEAASAGEKYFDEPSYIADHFGQRVSVPTSPILTDKIMVGSNNR